MHGQGHISFLKMSVLILLLIYIVDPFYVELWSVVMFYIILIIFLDIAQHHGDDKIHDAVLTVPCFCSELEQSDIK